MLQLNVLKYNLDKILEGTESIVILDAKTTRLGDKLIEPNDYGYIYNLSYYTLSRENPTLPTTPLPNLFFPLQEELSQYTINSMANALGVESSEAFAEYVHSHLYNKKTADRMPHEYLSEDVVGKGTLAGAFIFPHELPIIDALTGSHNSVILDISLLVKSALLGIEFKGRDLDVFYNELMSIYSKVKFSVDDVIIPYFDIIAKYHDAINGICTMDTDLFWKSLWLRSASQEVLVETVIVIEMLKLAALED